MAGSMTSLMTRRTVAVVIAGVSSGAILAGCTRSVAGTAVHAGPGDAQRQENSAQQ
jgi:hypothetical protein